jgi:hypothetical protein
MSYAVHGLYQFKIVSIFKRFMDLGWKDSLSLGQHNAEACEHNPSLTITVLKQPKQLSS